ncbi:aldehyde dehydrogenase [Mycobacterium sp. IDR2000157661]|uniref:aldehyde dehydrogenase n=1 Tax=Mycobacterium sp. IDR2000157661 TaxID=2867005 RepID=UPI001EEC6ED7|nr:aldehyde dehydrogenase [Mycobacterium sp. IDR2000157661]ULE32580.1 aldehyde dehydrogenase [Mycobacterium sp. IDR2000157661]
MQHLITAQTHARTVAQTAETLGAPLPAAYLDALDRADALAGAVSPIAKASAGQLTNAAISALEQGRDPHTDKAVQRLLTSRVLASSGIEQAARTHVNQLLAAALCDHADEVLTGWADALEPYAADLYAAAEAVPHLNVTDTDRAIKTGGETMHHLHKVQAAVVAWEAATHGFNMLGMVAGIRSGPRTAPLILTPASHDDLEPAYELKPAGDLDVWELAKFGLPLRLATLGEYMERVAQFQADRAAAQREDEQRSKDRLVKSW